MPDASQEVVVVRVADRHAALHSREFAEALRTSAPAGPLNAVLASALDGLDLPRGRYIVTVDWPADVDVLDDQGEPHA